MVSYESSRTFRRSRGSSTCTARLSGSPAASDEAPHEGTKRYLEKQWKPLHGLSMQSVGRANVAAEANVIAKNSGNPSANRARASLSFFRWAIGEGLCEENPVTGTNKQEENGPRERSLTDDEASVIFQACRDNDYGRIVQLLMLTGCRRDEIGSLEWSEINFEAETITIPGTRTKNHNEHVVPLTNRVLAILKAVPRRERDHVFGAGKGGYSEWSKSKAEFDGKVKIKDWTLHDIRRTVRSEWALSGLRRMLPKQFSITFRLGSSAPMTAIAMPRRKRPRWLHGLIT